MCIQSVFKEKKMKIEMHKRDAVVFGIVRRRR